MSYTDYYLRAADEVAMKAALPWALWGDDADGEFAQAEDWRTQTREYSVDPIGPVVTADAVMAEDGETVVTPAVVDTAFHLNLRCAAGFEPDIPAELIVTPTTPSRMFA